MALCTAIRKAKAVTFKAAPIKSWLAAHRGASSDSIATPTMGQASSSSGAYMPLLDLSGSEQHADVLRQQLSEVPAIPLVVLCETLIQTRGVYCLERTMQSWLERARASAPKRTIERGSSDLPTLESLEEHSDYPRGLLAEDPSMGRRLLR